MGKMKELAMTINELQQRKHPGDIPPALEEPLTLEMYFNYLETSKRRPFALRYCYNDMKYRIMRTERILNTNTIIATCYNWNDLLRYCEAHGIEATLELSDEDINSESNEEKEEKE